MSRHGREKVLGRWSKTVDKPAMLCGVASKRGEVVIVLLRFTVI